MGGPPSAPNSSRTPTSSRSPSSASIGRPASAGAGPHNRATGTPTGLDSSMNDSQAKRIKMEENARKSGHESDSGDKSDGDLVVDVGNEEDQTPRPMVLNGEHRDSNGREGGSTGDRGSV